MKPQPSIFAWAAERLAEAMNGPAVTGELRRRAGARHAAAATSRMAAAGAVS